MFANRRSPSVRGAVASAFLIALAVLLVEGRTARGAADKQDVRVVNTAAEAVPVVPVGTASVRVVEQPFQQIFSGVTTSSGACLDVPLPAGETITIEHLAVTPAAGNVLADVELGVGIKTGATTTDGFSLYSIPVDTSGRGAISARLTVNANTLEDARVGDVFGVAICFTNNIAPQSGGVRLLIAGHRG